MCKYHKDVARDIATDDNGVFHAGKYAVALMAMAHFRIEQYMPSMFGDDGFVPVRLATPEAQQALKDTGLRSCLHTIAKYRDAHIGALRTAIGNTAAAMPLSLRDLNITEGDFTPEGYKATPAAAPDLTTSGPFLEHAVVYLFDGYDDAEKTYVSKGRSLSLVPTADDARFEAIRAATEHFVSQPGIMDVLRQMFEDSLVRVFKEAPEAARLGQGFNETSGCVMCHNDERRQAINDNENESEQKKPAKQGLSATFNACVALGHGLKHQLMCGGIMLAGHLLADPLPTVGKIMAHPATNIALIGLAGWCWYRGDKHWMQMRGQLAGTWEKAASRGLIAVAGAGMMYMHVPGNGMHDHSHHGGGHDHHKHQGNIQGCVPPVHHHQQKGDDLSPEARAWLENLDSADRKRVEEKAATVHMSLGQYLNGMCGLPPVPSSDKSAPSP